MAELPAGETVWSLLLHLMFSLREADLGRASVAGMGNRWKVSVQGAIRITLTALNGCSSAVSWLTLWLCVFESISCCWTFKLF